jgi:hypothetical protein
MLASTPAAEPRIEVFCYRIYPSGHDSHFICVQHLYYTGNCEDTPRPAPFPSDLYVRHRSTTRRQRNRVEEPSYEYDADRPLERSRWRDFLAVLARTDVLRYAVEPGRGSSPHKSKIWDGVASITMWVERLLSSTSHFVRVATIRRSRAITSSDHSSPPAKPDQTCKRVFGRGSRSFSCS